MSSDLKLKSLIYSVDRSVVLGIQFDNGFLFVFLCDKCSELKILEYLKFLFLHSYRFSMASYLKLNPL